jgi:hypothetical protein
MCVPDYVRSGEDPVKDFCEDSMKHSSLTEGGKFLDQLRFASFSKNISLLSEQI